MADWQQNLIEDDDGVRELLEDVSRVAVLGIKPESRRQKAAFYVPEYLQQAGYDIIPVPVYYPDVTEILGRPIVREVAEIEGDVDVVDVFRKADDIPPHVPDILKKKPRYVWFQLGIRNDDAARELAEAGIKVVQNRCMLADHRRLLG